MGSIKNRVLELQEDVAQAVTLADNSAHEVMRSDGSLEIMLASVNTQVAHLQRTLANAVQLQATLQSLRSHAQMRRPSISG